MTFYHRGFYDFILQSSVRDKFKFNYKLLKTKMSTWAVKRQHIYHDISYAGISIAICFINGNLMLPHSEQCTKKLVIVYHIYINKDSTVP